MKKWVAGISEIPVYRNGVSSTNEYVIVAVAKEAKEYNCVCVRPNPGYLKVKFYPSMDFWGLTNKELRAMGFGEFSARDGMYQRVVGTKKAIHQLLEQLVKNSAMSVVSVDDYEKELVHPDRMNHQSRGKGMHPVKGGLRPSSVYFVDGVEE